MLKFYGLKTCDTCRKAKAWLKSEGIEFREIDVRSDGISAENIAHFEQSADLMKLLNKASTTWRGLDENKKSEDPENIRRLIVENPTLLKRPVFDFGDKVFVGFRDAQKAQLLKMK